MQVTTEREYGVPDIDAVNWNSTFFDEFASKVDTDVQSLFDEKITLQVSPPGAGATTQTGHSLISGYHGALAFALTNGGVNKGYLAVANGGGAFVSGSVAGDVVLRTAGGPLLITFDDGSTVHYKADAGSIRSPGYAAGSAGWAISSTGDAEFNSIFARGGLSSIVVNLAEVNATAGAQLIGKSGGSLGASYTTPATAPTTLQSLTVLNTIASTANFAVNDVLYIRTLVGSHVRTAWFTITARTVFLKTTVYTCTFQSGDTSISFPAGTAVVDLGPNPSGYITLSADGAFGPSANQSFFTHTGTPWTSTKLVGRVGNLNGVGDIATNIYGAAFANDWSLTATTGLKGLMVDPTNGFRLWGCDIALYNGATQTVSITSTGQAQFGSNVATAAGRTFAVYPIAGTVNGESLVAGSVLIGDNTAGGSPQPNVIWNPTAKQLQIRLGTTVNAYVDADGKFKAAGGAVWIDDTGINTGASASYVKRVRYYDDAWSTEMGSIATQNIGAGGSAGTDVIYDVLAAVFPPARNRFRVTAPGGTNVNYTEMVARQEAASSNSRFSFYAAGSNVLTGLSVNFNAAPSAMVHVVSGSELLRLGYDFSNYIKVTVASSGATTIATVGSTAANAHLTLAPASGAVRVDQSLATYAARHSGTGWARFAQFATDRGDITGNMYFDGANWKSDNTGVASALMTINNPVGGFQWYYAAAGAGNLSLVTLGNWTSSGLAVGSASAATAAVDITGSLKVSSTVTVLGAGSYFGTGALVGVNSQIYGGTTNFEVAGGRSAFSSNGDVYAIGVRWSNSGSYAAAWIGATQSSTPSVVLSNTSGTQLWMATHNGNLVPGTGALAPNATDGFQYIPTCAGAPSGTPTAYTGRVAMVYDTTNNRLYVYNGAWKSAAFA